MISAQEAIDRVRRDGVMSGFLKAIMLTSAGVILSLHFFPLGKVLDPTLLLMLLGVAWVALWYRTIKGSRLAARSTSLLAMGDFELAEKQIEETLKLFSLSRWVKSMSLLNLALLRTAQSRWPDAAILSREVLSGPKAGPDPLAKQGRLVLAESLLELGDLRGAHEAIMGLYNHRLTLSEAINLLRVQSDYLSRIGAWGELAQNIASKVELSELLSTASSARVQAQLALAALKVGQVRWAEWLKSRVELLVEPRTLWEKRPALLELWQTNG